MDASTDIAPFLARLTDLLHAEDTDVRWRVTFILTKAARQGRSIEPAVPTLEALFGDTAVPSHLRLHLSVFAFSVGAEAIKAVTIQYLRRDNSAAIGRLIAAEV